jgi:glycine/D-amino acid oxidase-like deaminating enzyme
MTTVVLGAGVVGVATAWYLRKSGHDVVLIERQAEAAMETSWGNGGIIHASEVEPWSQPGMPAKIIKGLGKEDAPLLLRYRAIPQMFGWGLAFASNCTAERFRENALSNLHLALYSLRSLQEIGAETGIAYDRATRGVLKIYRSNAGVPVGGAERLVREIDMRHAGAPIRVRQPLDGQGFVWPLSRENHGMAANDWEIADAGGKNILEKDANQFLEQKTPAEQIDVL